MTGPTRPVALPAPATRLAPTLQAFFTERLIHQRNASTHTIAAYRDTWRLLLTYLRDQHTITASEVSFTDLGADIIAGFLDHLRHTRGNTDRTSNARLAAIRSLFTYAAPRHPEHADLIARVLAISPRTTHRPVIDYLTVAEADALLAAPDRTTWIGRRDHLLILILLTTGLRVSELTGLTRADIFPGHGAHLACHGKGRKDRVRSDAYGRWHGPDRTGRNQTLDFFLEYDTGTENLARPLAKLDGYQQLADVTPASPPSSCSTCPPRSASRTCTPA